MRAFVAGELPGASASALAVWAASATDRDPALRLVSIDALHLTLAFLGVLGRDEVDDVASVLSEVVAEGPWPAELSFGAPLWLSPRRPHVLASAVQDPSGALAALQERVSDRLADVVGAYVPDARGFLAHVTVARLRRGMVPRSMDVPAPAGLPSFSLSGVTLMRSTLAPGGAQYEALSTVGP